jgi:hypothetical protein
MLNAARTVTTINVIFLNIFPHGFSKSNFCSRRGFDRDILYSRGRM